MIQLIKAYSEFKCKFYKDYQIFYNILLELVYIVHICQDVAELNSTSLKYAYLP